MSYTFSIIKITSKKKSIKTIHTLGPCVAVYLAISYALKALQNFVIFNRYKQIPLNITYHAIIHPIIIHLISPIGLDNIHSREALSTVALFTGIIFLRKIFFHSINSNQSVNQ